MMASAVVVCVAGLWRWTGQAESIWPVIAILVSFILLIREVQTVAPVKDLSTHQK